MSENLIARRNIISLDDLGNSSAYRHPSDNKIKVHTFARIEIIYSPDHELYDNFKPNLTKKSIISNLKIKFNDVYCS